jgi:nucleotide-binding universal stress UspA family protein
MNVQKILVPTDFSEASEPAVRYAIDLADKFSAKVTLLHAFGLPVYPIVDGAILPTPQSVVDLVSDVDRALDMLRTKVYRSGIAIDTRSVQGPPAESIVSLARDERFNLIVIGTHGRTGLKRFALGSVAEHVVRTATIPVLTVHSAPMSAESAVSTSGTTGARSIADQRLDS